MQRSKPMHSSTSKRSFTKHPLCKDRSRCTPARRKEDSQSILYAKIEADALQHVEKKFHKASFMQRSKPMHSSTSKRSFTKHPLCKDRSRCTPARRKEVSQSILYAKIEADALQHVEKKFHKASFMQRSKPMHSSTS